MARAISWLALIVAYAATVLFLAAMVTPWWYAKYYAVNESNNSFYDSNPSLDQHTGLFHMTNCFIDGSCITGDTIYKNNSSLQWVYTAVIVLMIVAWVPWLYFVHLLHFRANKNRVVGRANRPLLLLSALLTAALLIAAVIVFAVGMVYTNGVYRDGLYGHRQVVGNNAGYVGVGQNVNDDFTGTNGHNDKRMKARTAGSGPTESTPSTPSQGPSSSSAVASSTSSSVSTSESPSSSTTAFVGTSMDSQTASSDPVVPATTQTTTAAPVPVPVPATTTTGSDNNFGFSNGQYSGVIPPVVFGSLPFGNQNYSLLGAGIPLLSTGVTFASLNGTLGYKWGPSSAWYCALFAIPLVLLAMLLALAIKTENRTVTTTRTTERVIANQPAVVPQQGYVVPQQGFVAPQQGYVAQPAYTSGNTASAAL